MHLQIDKFHFERLFFHKSLSCFHCQENHLDVDEVVAAGRLLLLLGVHPVEDRAASGGRRGGGRRAGLLEKEVKLNKRLNIQIKSTTSYHCPKTLPVRFS